MITAPVLRGVDSHYIRCSVGVYECYLCRSQFHLMAAVSPALCLMVFINQCSVDVVFHWGVVITAGKVELSRHVLGVESEDTADIEITETVTTW